MVSEPQFDNADNFRNGYARIRIEDQYGFIDRKGNIPTTPRLNDAYLFSWNPAPVQIGTKWGYIDNSGAMALPPVYKEALSFSEGMARVKTDSGWQYIDTSGKSVRRALDGAGKFSEGLAAVGKDTLEFRGLYPGSGAISIIPGNSWRLFQFKEDKKWGFIDRTGNIAVKPRFVDVHPFSK